MTGGKSHATHKSRPQVARAAPTSHTLVTRLKMPTLTLSPTLPMGFVSDSRPSTKWRRGSATYGTAQHSAAATSTRFLVQPAQNIALHGQCCTVPLAALDTLCKVVCCK